MKGKPAENPATIETITSQIGATPAAMMLAVIAPPREKLPSIVRSGNRITLKESMTPSVTRPYSNP